MPLYKQKSPVQRVIIPKGLVNPTETTVIEIPLIYNKQDVVVAQKRSVGRKSPRKVAERDLGDYLVEGLRGPKPKPKRGDNINKNVRPAQCDLNLFPDEVLDLEKTEEKEKIELEKTLEEFQRIRRKLLSLTTRITSSNTPATRKPLGSTYSDANEEEVTTSNPNLPPCKWIDFNGDAGPPLSRSTKISRYQSHRAKKNVMDSEEEEKPKCPPPRLSSQVLEYYQKYSLNKELPKYFCGKPAPRTSEQNVTVPIPSLTIEPDSTDCSIDYENKASIKGDRKRESASPTSSVTSNRKLEWDNGADIGYSNAEAAHRTRQKSVSLPILSTLERIDMQRPFLHSNPEEDLARAISVSSSSESRQSRNSKKLVEGTSSESIPNDANIVITTSSDTDSRNKTRPNSESRKQAAAFELLQKYRSIMGSDSDSSKSTKVDPPKVSSFLKKKIGFPVAESTPFTCGSDPELFTYSQTPVMKLPQTNRRNRMIAREIKTRSKNQPKLTVSNPVLIECVGSISSKASNCHKLVQTSLTRKASIGVQTNENGAEAPALPVQDNERLSPRHHQAIFYLYHSEGESKSSSATTQTESDVVLSKCNSFEYVSAEEYDKNLKSEKLANISGDASLHGPAKGKSNSTSDESLRANANTERRQPKPFTPTSSTSDSIEESPLANIIAAKQSSQPIPNVEKILELVQKMLRSTKYNEATKRYYVKKVVQKIVDSDDSPKPILKYSKSDDSSLQPATTASPSSDEPMLIKDKPKPVLSTQTFTDEIVSKTDELEPLVQVWNSPNRNRARDHIVPQVAKRLRHPKLTLPNSPPLSSSTESEKSKLGWRDDLTKSERILVKKCQGDCVDNGGRKEVPKVMDVIVSKPQIEDLDGIQKSTTLYVVTTNKPRGSEVGSSRRVVIENHPKPHCSNQPDDLVARTESESDEADKKRRNVKCNATVRRYTFDIPLSKSCGCRCHCSKIQTKCECCAKPDEYKKNKATPSSSSLEDISELPVEKSKIQGKSCQYKSGKVSQRTNCSEPCSEGYTKRVEMKPKSCHCDSRSNKSPTNVPNACLESLNKSCQCGTSSCKSSKPKSKYCQCESGSNRPSLQSSENTNSGESNKCGCVTEDKACQCETSSGKSSKTLDGKGANCYKEVDICELQDKSCQYPDPKSSDTGPNKNHCDCCKCRQTKQAERRSASPPSSPSSSFSSEDLIYCKCKPVANMCHCCKQNAVPANTQYVLCYPCYRHNRYVPYYTYPGHVCSCYNQQQQACRLPAACQTCGRKIKRRKGIAYLLTLEDQDPRHIPREHKRQKPRRLKEIRIAVPKFGSYQNELLELDSCENKCEEGDEAKTDKKNSRTVQEYLSVNKPSFVQAAEDRRKRLIELAESRERRCEKYKQLLALTNGKLYTRGDNSDTKLKRLFSCKQMKEMTNRKYKTLPEVQKKMEVRKKVLMTKANRLLVDMYNKKLQKCVLNGKPNLPSNVSVIQFM